MSNSSLKADTTKSAVFNPAFIRSARRSLFGVLVGLAAVAAPAAGHPVGAASGIVDMLVKTS